jgi:hypothetical protein
MTSSPTHNVHSLPASPSSEDRKREAVAALDAVLATVGQGRSFLSPWECFHFGQGLKALLAGEYKKVWAAAESALTPFAERTTRAKAELRAAGPLETCSVALARQKLAAAKTGLPQVPPPQART